MENNNCVKVIGYDEVKTFVKTASAAYEGFKKAGLPGAIYDGYKAYKEATKFSHVIH